MLHTNAEVWDHICYHMLRILKVILAAGKMNVERPVLRSRRPELFLAKHVCLLVRVCLCVRLYDFLCVLVSQSMCLYQYLYISFSLSVSLALRVSGCLFVCLFVWLFVGLCLSVSLSLHV